MKKLFSILAPLLVSLFLYPSIVSASEYTGTISSDYFDYDSDGSYTTLKTYIDDYMQQNNLSYYLIIYVMDWDHATADLSNLYAYVYSSVPTYSTSRYGDTAYRINLYSSTTSSRLFKKIKGNSIVYNQSGQALNNVNNYVGDATYGTTYMIIDTNIDFIFSGNNTYNFTSSYGTFTVSNGVRLKGLVEIANSSPPDNTPLLTQFFTISIEKLQTICDFIVSSYIYLAVIVIFLIYCSIYLLRRLK